MEAQWAGASPPEQLYLGDCMGSLRLKTPIVIKPTGISRSPSWLGQAFVSPLLAHSSVISAVRRALPTSAQRVVHSTAMGKKASVERREGHNTNALPTSRKPCRTCGREMTPDPRQIAIGNQVETCSHSCRTFKIGKKTNQVTVSADTLNALRDRLQQLQSQQSVSSSRARYAANALEQLIRLASHSTTKDKTATVDQASALHATDVDAWIELVILAIAPSSSTTTDFLTGEDVEEALRAAARVETETSSEESSSTGPARRTLITTLESGPGCRERVRRSLRRLFILSRDKWACSEMVEGSSRGIHVLQNGKVVDGLAGVSFAKGPMQFRARSE